MDRHRKQERDFSVAHACQKARSPACRKSLPQGPAPRLTLLLPARSQACQPADIPAKKVPLRIALSGAGTERGQADFGFAKVAPMRHTPQTRRGPAYALHGRTSWPELPCQSLQEGAARSGRALPDRLPTGAGGKRPCLLPPVCRHPAARILHCSQADPALRPQICRAVLSRASLSPTCPSLPQSAPTCH